MDYNATLTITPSSPVEDDEAVDVLMEAFADYHPAVGGPPPAPPGPPAGGPLAPPPRPRPDGRLHGRLRTGA